MPLISVVIPVYNGERYLPRTLESLRQQTLHDFEVVMVDDGSTDSSADIMRSAAREDARFRMVSRSNGGLSAARNTGIEATHGEWIYFIDADDTLHPDALRRLFEAATSHQVPVMIGGYFEGVSESWPAEGAGSEGAVRVMDAARTLTMGLYQHRRINSACGVLMRADLMRGPDGLRFLEGHYYEDLELFPRLCLRAGRIGYLETPLYFYRQHPKSFVHTFSPSRLDALVVTDRICRLMEREMPELAPAACDRRFSAAFNILLLLERERPQGVPAPRYRVYGKTYAEIAGHCRSVIRQGRMEALRDPKVRLKNKLGALLSLFGTRPLRFLARHTR